MRAGNKDRSIEEVVIGLLEGEGRESATASTPAPAAADGGHNEFASMLAQSEHSIHHGSKGIAVFRGGVKEVENTVIELKKILAAEGISKVEVVGIHSGTPSDERRDARRPPRDGWRKIIVGTNVIESGVNLRWVDAGVSDGVRKVPHHREDTGADALVPEDLPQAGIIQQMGRINRDPAATGFARGIYILHAKNNFEQRLKQNGPAIDRESMLAPAFHAASLGYDPTQLKWDISPEHKAGLAARLERARQDLMRLELIHSDWSLTSEGAFINRLPVSPETGAMLNEAHMLDLQRLREKKPARVLRDMILIAAIGESRNLKLYSKKHHGADRERTSDLIDAMNAFRNARARATEAGIVPSVVIASNENELATATKEELHTLAMQRAALDAICADDNLSVNGYIQVAQLVSEISKRLGDKLGIAIAESDTPEPYDATRYDELKRAILNGHVNQLYQLEHGELRDLIRDTGNRKRDNGLPFSGYEIAESSIVHGNKKIGLESTLVVGYLRELQPKRAQGKPDDERGAARKKATGDARNEPMLVLSEVSIIPAPVFVSWAKDRAERYAPVISAAHVSPDGKLHANYAGHARFELPLSGEALRDAALLVSL
jgi:HrpA-like RNA helicase